MKLPQLLRWRGMIDLAAEFGISEYAMRQAVDAGKIKKRFPIKPTRRHCSVRAYYATRDVQAFCARIAGLDTDEQPK